MPGLPPVGAPRPSTLPSPTAAPRGVCGDEPSDTCRVLRDGRLTMQFPKGSPDHVAPACEGGGRVYFLDGLKKGQDGPVTPESARALSDEHASNELQKTLDRAREVARLSGCQAVTIRQAKGDELAGAYQDPKAVAIVHVGHGNQGTGHPVSADGQALGPESLDKEQVSKRLRLVENVVCEGGLDKKGFTEVLPPGTEFHGPSTKISTAKAKELVGGEVVERLEKALAK